MTLTPALQETLNLFTQNNTWTNREIAEELEISLQAAYCRTRRLRDAGHLSSYIMWLTVNYAGAAPWRDPDGNYRTWLVFYLSRTRQPDQIQSQFDPRQNPQWKPRNGKS